MLTALTSLTAAPVTGTPAALLPVGTPTDAAPPATADSVRLGASAPEAVPTAAAIRMAAGPAASSTAPGATSLPAQSAALDLAKSTRPMPHEIIIIRHAEKPDDTNDTGLAPRGEQRAQALAGAISQRYPAISSIFASAPSSASNRPALTVTPLASKLGLPINTDYADREYNALAKNILGNSQYAGKTIVICWHHGKIPQLAEALGATPPQNPWPDSQFDRIWQIDYNPDGQASIQDLPQNVLPGDSTR